MSPITVSTSSWDDERRRSKIRGWWPAARRRSTTCEPMKPAPPVTRMRLMPQAGKTYCPPGNYSCCTSSAGRRPADGVGTVVQRNARMVVGDPVRVGQVVGRPHDAMAGVVVDATAGSLDLVERDVLVEARGHPVGQAQASGMLRIELRAGDLVLPGHDL